MVDYIPDQPSEPEGVILSSLSCATHTHTHCHRAKKRCLDVHGYCSCILHMEIKYELPVVAVVVVFVKLLAFHLIELHMAYFFALSCHARSIPITH